jgi:hypothetical protein
VPISISMAYSGLSEVTKAVMDLPGKFLAAKKSAMKSVGWLVMTELRNHVEYGPPGWQKLHPLTSTYWKKKGAGNGRWVMRRQAPHSPATWLGKFARYRASRSGNTVQIDFGKGKRGKQPGRLDPQLSAIARRIDSGEQIAVTSKMRKKWAATMARASARSGKPVIGVNFFPLRKSTTTIDIPARPIFTPVFRKISPKVSRFFETKFWESYDGARNKQRFVNG